MAKLIILYGQPDDPEAFEDYYARHHLPFAQKRMPGVRDFQLSRVVPREAETPSYYRMAEMWWEDLVSLRSALNSEGGRSVLADLDNFATGGTTLIVSDTETGND